MLPEKPNDWHNLLDRDVERGNSQARTVVAGLASVEVCPANRRRKQIIFCNDSAAVIYLTKGPVATGAGIRLNAAGGTLVDGPDALGYMWPGKWSAIATIAASNLNVIEDT